MAAQTTIRASTEPGAFNVHRANAQSELVNGADQQGLNGTAAPHRPPFTDGMADAVTTMKITTATRDRLRTHAASGETLEDVVVQALDVYEAAQFWAQAEAWAAAETPAERAARKASEAEWDALMDGLR